MPLVRISTTRISAEKIQELITNKLSYNSLFNVSVKKESKDVNDETIYEYTLTLTSTPPAITITIQGIAFIRFHTKEELSSFLREEPPRRASIVANIVFPHVYATLILLSKELQIPPPLIKQTPEHESSKNRRNMSMMPV